MCGNMHESRARMGVSGVEVLFRGGDSPQKLCSVKLCSMQGFSCFNATQHGTKVGGTHRHQMCQQHVQNGGMQSFSHWFLIVAAAGLQRQGCVVVD